MAYRGVVVQVLGTNGSGKSTLLQTMAFRDAAVHHNLWVTDGTPALTILPTHRIVMVGDYLSPVKTPGADKLRGREALLAALDHAVEVAQHLEGAVIWEGIMLITRAWPEEYARRGYRVAFPVLHLSAELAHARVHARTGKPLKQGGEKIYKRYREVVSLARWLAANGRTVWELDAVQPLDTLARMMLRRVGRLMSGY